MKVYLILMAIAALLAYVATPAMRHLAFRTGAITAVRTRDDNTIASLIAATLNAVFGFIVALLGCYNGFNSKGGAQGVGNATTNAVVSSSILILAADYVLTALLFHK